MVFVLCNGIYLPQIKQNWVNRLHFKVSYAMAKNTNKHRPPLLYIENKQFCISYYIFRTVNKYKFPILKPDFWSKCSWKCSLTPHISIF